MSEPIAIVRGLTKRYRDTTALDAIDLELNEGELVALLGPNGSGKSTLLGLLGGWLAPTAGSLRVLGADAAHPLPPGVRREIGVVFQGESLDPLLSVRENLSLHAATSGVEPGARRACVERSVEEFGLGSVADRRAGVLSGGWRRRADLARATLPGPRLLLLDEPSAGLDPEARDRWSGVLDAFRGRHPSSLVVLCTHLLDEAERATRVVMLDAGRVIANDAPRGLLGEDRFVVGIGAESRVVEPTQLGEVAGDLGAKGEPFTVRQRSLDDVFRERTGHDLTSPDAEAIA